MRTNATECHVVHTTLYSFNYLLVTGSDRTIRNDNNNDWFDRLKWYTGIIVGWAE